MCPQQGLQPATTDDRADYRVKFRHSQLEEGQAFQRLEACGDVVARKQQALDKNRESVILIVIMKRKTIMDERQLPLLFPNADPSERCGPKVVTRPLSSKLATFKGGMEEPVHRWFRLTPSFGPQLVRDVMDELAVGQDSTVLDPFAGAGTTLIECQLNGIRSYGFEIHPFLHWVAATSLDTEADEPELRHHFSMLSESFLALSTTLPPDPAQLPLDIPPIHNPYRWWRKDVLRDLMILKIAIQNLEAPLNVTEFLKLGLAGVLVPELTNVTLGRLQLHFKDRSKDDINVWTSFENHMASMITDVVQTQRSPREQSQVFLTDATDLSANPCPTAIDFVITSPPYPNRYSYVWNTRPHLYFFDFFGSAREASQLDSKIVGGTWGTATSMLKKGKIEAAYDAVDEYVIPISERIRERDNLMANYVVKYFNGLARQLVEMGNILNAGAKLAYVVGCSEIKGVYIETDVLLANLMERLPFRYSVQEIRRIRKRNSGQNLYESIVYARANAT